jgi:hypothetical membrane protein
MIILGIDMLQVEGITQEYPSPSQIRSQAPGRIRRKGDSLPLLAIQGIFLVGIGILQHHRIIKVLRFYIPFIYIGELSKEGCEGLTQTMKECALMTGTNKLFGRKWKCWMRRSAVPEVSGIRVKNEWILFRFTG